MIQLSDKQRAQLLRFVKGDSRGSYFAAQTVLLLDNGKDEQFVSKAMFCTPEDVRRVVQAFESGSIDAVINYKW